MLIMFQKKIVVGKIFSKFQKFFDNELKFDAIILILFEFLSNHFYFRFVQKKLFSLDQNIPIYSEYYQLNSDYLILQI